MTAAPLHPFHPRKRGHLSASATNQPTTSPATRRDASKAKHAKEAAATPTARGSHFSLHTSTHPASHERARVFAMASSKPSLLLPFPIPAPNPSDEVVREFGPLLRIYKSGRIERPLVAPPVDPGHDAATGVQSKDVHLGSYSARLYLPPVAADGASASAKLPVVVYVHGGGFVAASPGYHLFLNRLAAACPALVVFVDYRLAPEHPLPARYDDCLAALKWVLSAADPWVAAAALHEAAHHLVHRRAFHRPHRGPRHHHLPTPSFLPGDGGGAWRPPPRARRTPRPGSAAATESLLPPAPCTADAAAGGCAPTPSTWRTCRRVSPRAPATVRASEAWTATGATAAFPVAEAAKTRSASLHYAVALPCPCAISGRCQGAAL